MGLFDTLKVEHQCTGCYENRTEYQTKALGSFLEIYHLGDKPKHDGYQIIFGNFELYDYCGNCDTNMKARGVIIDGLIAKVYEWKDNTFGALIAEHLDEESSNT